MPGVGQTASDWFHWLVLAASGVLALAAASLHCPTAF